MQFTMTKQDRMEAVIISTILMKNSWKLRQAISKRNWIGLLRMNIFLKNLLKVRSRKNIEIKWNSALEMQ